MATYDEAHIAFQAGASVLTHAFNAMRPLSSREPGPVVAALEAGAWIEVISDGHHLHPSVVKFLSDAAPERLLLVTDSMPAAGLGDGSYELGALAVSVVDGVARTGDGSLAGSTLSLEAAVRNTSSCGVPPGVALAAATTNPLVAYGQAAPALDEGGPANLLVWSDQMQITHLIRDGHVTAFV
jgi:N-acetylglucosamine-6-phosphate deacetylase